MIIPVHRINVGQKMTQGDFTASHFVNGNREVDRTPIIAFHDDDTFRMIARCCKALKSDVFAATSVRHHGPKGTVVFGQLDYRAIQFICHETLCTFLRLRTRHTAKEPSQFCMLALSSGGTRNGFRLPALGPAGSKGCIGMQWGEKGPAQYGPKHHALWRA